MQTVNKSINNFFKIFEKQILSYSVQDKNIILFRQCVYSLLLLKILLIWPELPMFYRHRVNMGTGSLAPHKLMLLPLFQEYYNIYWALAALVVGFAIFSKGNRIVSVAVLIISLSYLQIIVGAYDTGDKLHNFLILMLLFIRENAVKHSLRQMITNAAVLIIKLHFCLLYFVNAAGKIIHPFWRNGSLFNDIWHLSYFANPNFVPVWFFNPTLQFITAWSVIIFEFMFPVMIWFKPYKNSLIFIGLLFHVGISMLLSIPDFGITMMLVYILFYDFKTAKKRFSEL